MGQKLFTPTEQAIVGPHIRHPNPHPQYELAGSIGGPAPDPSASLPAAQSIGTAGQVGTSVEYARGDHRHPMPGLADISNNGFMSAADKILLATLGTNPVISPLAGGVLDADNGTLVWDTSNLEQVVS